MQHHRLLRLSAILVFLSVSLPAAHANPIAKGLHGLHAVASGPSGSGSRVDTCANIDQGVLRGPDGRTDYGSLSGCLCHSTLARFTLLSPAAVRASRTLGPAQTRALLRGLIDSDPSSRTCEYPSHAVPDCTREDVCGWACEEGYMRCGGRCVAGASACEDAKTDSPAPPAHAVAAVLPEWFPHEEDAEDSLDVPPLCANGYIACPAPAGHAAFHHLRRSFPFVASGPGSSSSSSSSSGSASAPGSQRPPKLDHTHLRPASLDPAYICIEPSSDAEHCGGCSSLSPSSSPSSALLPAAPAGTDCTALRGAVSTMCNAGACIVHRCKAGWDVGADGTACVRRYTLRPGQVRLHKPRPVIAEDAEM